MLRAPHETAFEHSTQNIIGEGEIEQCSEPDTIAKKHTEVPLELLIIWFANCTCITQIFHGIHSGIVLHYKVLSFHMLLTDPSREQREINSRGFIHWYNMENRKRFAAFWMFLDVDVMQL